MTKLKKIELNGFKSFNKKTVLEFNSPVTAIVGPNGSGKSNIAEAFRFVLGEQSIKSMRGKKGEDLIWNGSSSAPKQNRAVVSICIDNSKKVFNIPYDELNIERVVYRDGLNDYSINGSKVRLKDIVDCLSGANIGPTGHHMVSQGEADKILTVNPIERRIMIEDSLGLRIYHAKKREGERKLEKTRENLDKAEALRREIAPHLRFLKKQVEKIEKSFALKNELVSLYKQYFAREALYLNFQKSQLQNQINPIKNDLESLTKRLSNAEDLLNSGKSENKDIEQIILVEHSLKDVREQKDLLTREIGRADGGIEAANQSITLLMTVVKDEKVKTVSVEQIKSLETYLAEAKQAIANSSFEPLKQAFESLLRRIADFIERVNSSNTNNNQPTKQSLEQKITELKSKKSQSEDKLIELKHKEERLLKEHEQARQKAEQNKDSLQEAEKEVLKASAEMNQKNSDLRTLNSQLENLQMEENLFKQELTEASVLAGHQALDYKNEVILNTEGKPALDSDILSESRVEQQNRRKSIERIKIKLEDDGLGSSEEILKEHRETEERDKFLEKEIADLEQSSKGLEILIAELNQTLKNEFNEGIKKINIKFKELFSLMFGGGAASIKIVKIEKRQGSLSGQKAAETDEEVIENLSAEEDNDEPEEGIELDVTLPNKKMKGLIALSGGERTLTSLALMFAIASVTPPPFIILDETDAALDEANSKKYGEMIKSISENSQLIFITHNRETMNRANSLYGVTIGADGGSKILSVAFEEANDLVG